MMSPCEKCNSNKWAYKIFDGIVHATCDSCGHKIEFRSKTKEGFKKEIREGDKCDRRDRDCPGLVFWKIEEKMNVKRLKQAYHYEKWLKCNKCGAIFMNEKYKIFHEIGVDGKIRFRRSVQ